MDQHLPQPKLLPQEQSNPVMPTAVPAAAPHVLNEQPQPPYVVRLFSGRLNRQNYIVGSTFFVLVPLICFTIVIFNILLSPDTFAMPYLDPNNPGAIITPQVNIISLLKSPTNELWSILGIISFVLSFPFVFSIQIRRLHDLNLSGWFWIINFGSLLPVYSMFSSGISGILTPKVDAFFWIAEIIGTVASFFSLYVSIWPGTKGENKFGAPPIRRSSFVSDVLKLK